MLFSEIAGVFQLPCGLGPIHQDSCDNTQNATTNFPCPGWLPRSWVQGLVPPLTHQKKEKKKIK